MARYGNISPSALLRQANAAANKTQEYNDAIASFNFYISAATPEAFQTYSDYLQGRIKKVQSSDPSKALSLQRTAEEAYRRYNSSEISRASLAVNYGQISNRDKYGRILGLYQNAIANGDEALAARLESNLASLSITIQNEDSAAAGRGGGGGGRGGGGGSSSDTKELDNLLKSYDTDLASGRLTPADYFSKASQAYKTKEQILQAQADAGSSSAQNNLLSLQANDSFQKITSPDVQMKLQRGEIPLAIKRDNAGNLKYEFIKEANVKAVLGPDGKPMHYSDIKDQDGTQLYPNDNRVLTQGTPIVGYTGDHEVQRIRKAGLTPDSPDAIFQYDTLPKQNPTDLNKIFDFTSGRQLVLSNKGEGKTAQGQPQDYAYVLGADGNPISGTDPYGLAAAAGDPSKVKPQASDLAPGPSAPEFYGDLLKPALQNPGATINAIKGGIGTAAHALTGFLGDVASGGGNILNSLISKAKGHDIEVAKAKAEAARQEAIRQAQEENARQFAQIQAQNAANAVAAQKRPSILYRPLPYTQRTVQQNYAIGSQGKSTPAAVARGIGEVVGYNKLLKGVGLF